MPVKENDLSWNKTQASRRWLWSGDNYTLHWWNARLPLFILVEIISSPGKKTFLENDTDPIAKSHEEEQCVWLWLHHCSYIFCSDHWNPLHLNTGVYHPPTHPSPPAPVLGYDMTEFIGTRPQQWCPTYPLFIPNFLSHLGRAEHPNKGDPKGPIIPNLESKCTEPQGVLWVPPWILPNTPDLVPFRGDCFWASFSPLLSKVPQHLSGDCNKH